MEITKEFGVNPVLIGAQIVNFLIILYLLKRFMYKPILQVLKNRENTIREGLKKAEEAQLLMEKTKEEERKILKKASENASKILEEAKAHAEEIGKEAEKRAAIQTEKMIQDAQEHIERDTKMAQEMLAKHVSTLAVGILKRSIASLLTEREKREVIEKALKTFEEKVN